MPTLRVKSIAKANMDLWLNNLFLTDGFYSTVNVGETDVYGRDISLLSSVEDPSFASNSVFQSAFKSWVHESGISPTSAISPPLLASGVTVDGTFYPRHSYQPGYNASFAHSIDFVNGRIMFDSPISSSAVVQAEFSYKAITVDFADRYENESEEFYFSTSYKDHPYQSGVVIYPEVNARTLPFVQIDFTSRTNTPYELGNTAGMTAELRGTLHVWTRDSADKDLIDDLILQQDRPVLNGININTAPMPLDYKNDKNESYTSYGTLAIENGTHFYRRIYIDELVQVNTPPLYNIERGRIDFVIRIYPTF